VSSADLGAILAYIDDGSVMSTNQELAQHLHDRVCEVWKEKGFVLHDEKGHDAVCRWEKVGVRFDGVSGRVELKESRRWRLSQATDGLLARQSVQTRELEILVSHYTTAFLLRRPLLSVFHYTYEWIQRGPTKRHALPDSVREEFLLAQSLLPLCFAQLKAPYSPWVYCSDSSESHYCVMRADHSPDEVKSVYGWHEM
jgi:hypothetical protein